MVFDKEKNILVILLSGSRARGDFRDDSDYDLMFITKSEIKASREYGVIHAYREKIADKTKIKEDIIQIYLWSLRHFKKEHKKGNSFVYCALRDGKVLCSRHKLNLKIPNNCQKAAMNRIGLAKERIKCLEFFLKNPRGVEISYLWLEDLGYCSMHLCWAICMFNNFCPVSKYTVLKESRKYFTLPEFNSIKKSYNFYADRTYKKIRKKTFLKLLNNLKNITKRIESTFSSK